jgi:predicted amidophosphoribosyltransferase
MSIYLVLLCYAIWGIGWGLLCLAIAKEKKINPGLWSLLGFLFSIITFFIIIYISGNGENTSVCPVCNHKVGWKDRYCSNCGELLKGQKNENYNNTFCSNCGKEIKNGYKFCPNCGRLLTQLKSYDFKTTHTE